MLKYNPFKDVIGLDISDFKLRFFQFRKGRGGKFHVNSFGETACPDGLIQNGTISDPAKVQELITQMIKKPSVGKVTTKFVNAALPEKRVFLKKAYIPDVPDEEMKGAVQWAIEQNIPVEVEEMLFDWQVIRKLKKDNENKIEVIMSVAPQELVTSYTSVIKSADLIPISLENESVAIARSLINIEAAKKTSLLIVDVGKSRTSIMIFDGGSITYTTTLETSGEQMTKMIMDVMKLSHEEAEKAKIIFGLSKKRSRGKIRDVVAPVLERMVQDIKENVDYYSTYMAPVKPITTVLLTGSVSRMDGLPQYIQDNLHMTVLLGDPWTNVFSQLEKYEGKKIDPSSYATAIGLALKQFQ